MQEITLSKNSPSFSHTIHGKGVKKITGYSLMIKVDGQKGQIEISKISDFGNYHDGILEIRLNDKSHLTIEYKDIRHDDAPDNYRSMPAARVEDLSVENLALEGIWFSGLKITDAEFNKVSSEKCLGFYYLPDKIEINECKIQDELSFDAGCKSKASIRIKNGSVIGTLDLSKQPSVKVEIQSKTNISNLTYDFVHHCEKGLIEIDAENSTIGIAKIKFNPCGSIIGARDCDFEELTIFAVKDSQKDNNSKSDIDFGSSRITKALKIDDETIKNVRITMPVLRQPFYKRTLPLTNPNDWHDMYSAFSNLKRNDLSNLCYALYFGSKKNDILSKLYFWLADAGLSWSKPVLFMIVLNLILFPCLYAFIFFLRERPRHSWRGGIAEGRKASFYRPVE